MKITDLTDKNYQEVIFDLDIYLSVHMGVEFVSDVESHESMRMRIALVGQHMDQLRDEADGSDDKEIHKEAIVAERRFHDILFKINTFRANNNKDIRVNISEKANSILEYIDSEPDDYGFDCDAILVFLNVTALLMRRLGSLYSQALIERVMDGVMEFALKESKEEDEEGDDRPTASVVPFPNTNMKH